MIASFARNLHALLLDAGNTIVFLDHARVADIVGRGLRADALRDAEAHAKRRYQALLASGGAHAQGFHFYFETMLVSAGLAPDAARAALPAIDEAHVAFNLFSRVGDGVPAALDRARAGGLRLGVVSNSEGKLEVLLEALGLSPRFEVILDSAIEGVSKPDPEIFRRALARLDVPAAEALYAGDIPDVDVVGARAAGMHAVLVDPFDHFPTFDGAQRVDGVPALVDALLAAR